MDILILAEDIIFCYFIWLQYQILEKIDGMSSETMSLLWSMKEKHNCNSQFKIYFDTLQENLYTGLTFSCNAYCWWHLDCGKLDLLLWNTNQLCSHKNKVNDLKCYSKFEMGLWGLFCSWILLLILCGSILMLMSDSFCTWV